MKLDENKRLILAIVVSLAILLVWRTIAVKYFPEPAPDSGTGTPAASSPVSPAAPTAQAPAETAAPAPHAPIPTAPVQAAKVADVTVESNVYRVVFAGQGALVKSWVLKKYTDANGKPLDLVNSAAASQLGLPLAITLPDSGLAAKINGAPFVATLGSGSAAEPVPSRTIEAPAEIEFVFSDGQTEVHKTFTFGDPNKYQVDVEVRAFDTRAMLPVGVVWPGGFGDYSLGPKSAGLASQAVYNVNGDLTKIKESKAKSSETVSGPVTYGGLVDLYFVDIFLPHSPAAAYRITRRSWTPPNWTEKDLPAPLQAELAMPAGAPLQFGLLLAPKDLDVLKSISPPLDDLVDFGFFKIIAKPLFLGLRYIYDHWIHNWGWAIVLLTVIINFLLFPLKLKSIHSAQRMQKVAPRIKRIQDQYKQYKMNDPRKQKMNTEIMEVYKEEGINPLGGCLPMVLQLPFLYAFYAVLGTVIEMRHAPWIGCVTDLSIPDACHPFGLPVALLPSLLIVSMFAMQKLTPMATADPAQQRMMYLMPLMFGVIFYRLAAGLVLYYMTANVVGIAQQLIINRFIPHTRPAPAGVPDTKALNTAGPPSRKGGKG